MDQSTSREVKDRYHQIREHKQQFDMFADYTWSGLTESIYQRLPDYRVGNTLEDSIRQALSNLKQLQTRIEQDYLATQEDRQKVEEARKVQFITKDGDAQSHWFSKSFDLAALDEIRANLPQMIFLLERKQQFEHLKHRLKENRKVFKHEFLKMIEEIEVCISGPTAFQGHTLQSLASKFKQEMADFLEANKSHPSLDFSSQASVASLAEQISSAPSSSPVVAVAALSEMDAQVLALMTKEADKLEIEQFLKNECKYLVKKIHQKMDLINEDHYEKLAACIENIKKMKVEASVHRRNFDELQRACGLSAGSVSKDLKSIPRSGMNAFQLTRQILLEYCKKNASEFVKLMQVTDRFKKLEQVRIGAKDIKAEPRRLSLSGASSSSSLSSSFSSSSSSSLSSSFSSVSSISSSSSSSPPRLGVPPESKLLVVNDGLTVLKYAQEIWQQTKDHATSCSWLNFLYIVDFLEKACGYSLDEIQANLSDIDPAHYSELAICLPNVKHLDKEQNRKSFGILKGCCHISTEKLCREVLFIRITLELVGGTTSEFNGLKNPGLFDAQGKTRKASR